MFQLHMFCLFVLLNNKMRDCVINVFYAFYVLMFLTILLLKVVNLILFDKLFRLFKK